MLGEHNATDREENEVTCERRQHQAELGYYGPAFIFQIARNESIHRLDQLNERVKVYNSQKAVERH